MQGEGAGGREKKRGGGGLGRKTREGVEEGGMGKGEEDGGQGTEMERSSGRGKKETGMHPGQPPLTPCSPHALHRQKAGALPSLDGFHRWKPTQVFLSTRPVSQGLWWADTSGNKLPRWEPGSGAGQALLQMEALPVPSETQGMGPAGRMLSATMHARVMVPPAAKFPRSPRQGRFAKCKRRAAKCPDLCIVRMERSWISGVVGCARHRKSAASLPAEGSCLGALGRPQHPRVIVSWFRRPKLRHQGRMGSSRTCHGTTVAGSPPAPGGCRPSWCPQSPSKSSHGRPLNKSGCTFPLFYRIPQSCCMAVHCRDLTLTTSAKSPTCKYSPMLRSSG